MFMRALLKGTLTFLFMTGMMAMTSLFAQEKDWSLVGTWVNPAYEKAADYPAKVVYGSDGTISLYHLSGDTTPYAYGPYVIEKDWTESGIHWFRVKLSFAEGVTYEIDRLTEGGTKYESVFSTGMYPSLFETSGDLYPYTMRKRQ